MDELKSDELIDRVSAGTGVVMGVSMLKFFIPLFLVTLIFSTLTLLLSVHSITYVETTATIVDIKYNEEDDEYYPVYEFEVNGEKVRAEFTMSTEKEEMF